MNAYTAGKLMRPSTVVSEAGRKLRVFETDASESGEDVNTNMYTCMNMYIYIYFSKYIYKYIYIYIYIYICTYMYTCMLLYM